MRWKRKSRAFRVLSAMPFGRAAHFAIQRRVTKEWPRKRQDLAALVQRARCFIDLFERHAAVDIGASQFVEIGAGRDLALAVVLRMMGVRGVICIDVERLARLDLVQSALAFAAAELGAAPKSIRSWRELDDWGVRYLAPYDARHAELASDTLDCLVSSEVLEHIPPHDLRSIFMEAARYLRPDGLMLHAIDYSDHYARSDPSISRFNFLMFDDAQWRRHNSRFQYVSRLRHPEYVRIAGACGFDVVHVQVQQGEPTSEVRDNLARQFSTFADEDLYAVRAIIAARKRPSPARR